MSGTPGTFRFPEVNAKPAAPPSGYALIYIKTDDVLYLQDSTGTEVALGSASAITQIVGEASASGPGVATITLSNSAVIGKVLTGFTSGPASVVLSTDSILQAIQKLQGQVSATSGAAITALTGDVSASGPGSVAAVVNSVGGSSASNIHNAELAANAATSINTASTIVKRDASGNFAANVITAATFMGGLTGNVTGNVSGSSASFTGTLVGDVTGTQGATVVSTVGGSTAANIHSAELAANAATSVNTASTIVERDASGNFSAGVITASLIGNVTGNVSGTSLNVTGTVVIANGGTNSSTALSNNRIMISQGGAIVESSAVTAHRAIVSNSNGLPVASATTDTEIGYVSGVTSSIQAQLNAITGSAITSLTGDGTASGPGAAVFTLTNSSVTGQPLTGYSIGSNTPVLATDTILVAIEKLQGQASASSGSAITALTGDISATGPGSVSATVNSVGGSTAANIHSAELAANAATSANTVSTIVKRDSFGNFSAGTISASLSGNASSATTSVSFTGALLGDVTGTQGATVVSKIQGTAVSGTTGSGNVVLSASPTLTGTVTAAAANFSGSITASNFSGSSSGTNTGDVSITNTNSINLAFSSGQSGLTATLNLSAASADANNLKASYSIKSDGLFIEYPYAVPVNIGTTNATGSASSFSLSDHVHAISSSVVLGLTLTGYTIGSNTPIASSDSILVAFEKLQGQASAISGSAITSLTGDVTATGPGAATATIAVGAVTDTKASLSSKPAVTVVATTNQTLSGVPTIDGQALTAGTSIALLTAQSTASQNGPWIVQSGAWTRPTWFPTGGTTQAFQFITTLVRLGTTYQGSTWRMTTSGAITIDTTSTAWAVTPQSGNFKSSYIVGLQSGSSEVDLVFSNAFQGTLGWNPSSSFKLLLPPTLPTAGQYLSAADGIGTLAWTNPLVNIDGGAPDSIYTSGQIITGGTP